MMKLNKCNKGGIFGVLLMIAAFVSAVSCVAERENGAKSDGRRTGEVHLGAYVEDVAETRAQEAEYIESGTYYMTYPNFEDKYTYSVCTVNFYDGFGVTTTWNSKELKWEEVGPLTYNDLLTNFFLDNVAPPDADNPNATEIVFTESYHPFDAAVYDGDGGANDLLWGYAFVDLYARGEINIGIHHYMSRVSVVVTVDNTLDNAEGINFDNGSVKITNVIKKGTSFNRTNGRISLGDSYEDLELAVEGDWEKVEEDEMNADISYYRTRNFVIPPQSLRTDERRPRLVLDVPQADGTSRTYSGVIPRVMMVDGSPATMAFDPEKNLTLRVKISQDRLRIESIVAYVQDWVNKGSFLVSANRASIVSQEGFENLLEVYPDGDYDQIKEFGYLDTTPAGEPFWSFNIFTELTLECKAVAKKMAEPLPDFKFDMTSRRLTLIYSDGKKRMFGSYDPSDHAASDKAAQILHDLLRYGTEPNPDEGVDPDISGGGTGGDGGGDMDIEFGT